MGYKRASVRSQSEIYGQGTPSSSFPSSSFVLLRTESYEKLEQGVPISLNSGRALNG
jgi:hypothetical protein